MYKNCKSPFWLCKEMPKRGMMLMCAVAVQKSMSRWRSTSERCSFEVVEDSECVDG